MISYMNKNDNLIKINKIFNFIFWLKAIKI